MPKDPQIATLRGLKARLKHIDEVITGSKEAFLKDQYIDNTSVKYILGIVDTYTEIKTQLDRLGLHEISEIMPLPKIPNKASKGVPTQEMWTRDVVIPILFRIRSGCRAGVEAIDEVLKRQAIPEELANKLKGFRDELGAIDNIDSNIYKNLDEAISEMEHGHYLASALISARVVEYIVSKFPGKNIDEKINNLKDTGLIDKDRKDEVKGLTFAAKKARDFVSHNIKIYPSSDDAMVMLGNAVKLAKIYTEFEKRKEELVEG